jgi:hypothetical protein
VTGTFSSNSSRAIRVVTMKRSERHKVKTESDQRHSDPRQHETDNHERHISGGMNVRGEIETKRPPDLTKEHATERKEDKTSSRNKFIVEILTLIVVAIYAGLTAWQGCSTKTAAKAAKSAAETANRSLLEANRSWIEMQIAKNWQDTRGVTDRIAQLQKVHELSFELPYTNIGKFPVKDIFFEGNIDVVESDKIVNFDYHRLHNSVTLKILFPTRSSDIFAEDILQFPPNTANKLTDSVRRDLLEGNKYLAIYARGRFTDDFGTHWIQFCVPIAFKDGPLDGKPRMYSYRNCVDYNDAGDGPQEQ